jgi:ribonuclease Z
MADPNPPEMPRPTPLACLSFPPLRVQGTSIAGEETVVQVPELGVCFDIGRCPRMALTSPYVALTHGHMDHSAGIAYYFSQRNFQGMGVGTVVCHPAIEPAIHAVMRGWVDLEAQRTPYNVIALAPDAEIEIKPHTFLRAFATIHTVPSLGFVVIERRSKLRPDLLGLPQEQILAAKNRGENITLIQEVPLVCYIGDTTWGAHFDRPDVLGAGILITECTFLEPGHQEKAAIGQHLHLEHIVELLKRSKAKAVVLTHLSRRTHMNEVRRQMEQLIPEGERGRVHLLMDGRPRRQRSAASEGGAGAKAPAEKRQGNDPPRDASNGK